MTALKAHEVQRFLARPDTSEGIFLAYGPDAGLVREVGQTLARRFAGDDGDGPVVLDGNEVDADPTRLAVEAKTPSLFGGRRVVRVRSTGKSLVMALSELKDDMAGAAIIVEAGNLAPRDPLRALVETAKMGRALPCYPDSDETLERLINETFAKAGIAADPDVAPTLRDILGNDREVTRRELEKLELFAADTKILTRHDVLTLCADNAALAIDDISDAIGTGHAAELEDALSRALAAAVDGQQIVSSVARHFAQLRRWRAEVDHGKSPREVLDNARPKPHFSRRSSLEQQVRLWTDTALATATDRLWQGVSDARKSYDLSETVVRRALLAVCKQAAEH
jgi:DNA polymerase III subunit delta